MDYVFNAGNFPGDYLYYSGRSLELESGAWGIFRVMNTLHTSGPDALEAAAGPDGATVRGRVPDAHHHR